MLVHNLTPFAFASRLCARRPPQPELSLVVRGAYRIDPAGALEAIESLFEQGFLSAESYAEGDEERLGEVLRASDLADYKPRSEILVHGTCYPPRGSAKETFVEVGLGDWSKRVAVLGRRVWQPKLGGRAPDAPRPFDRMPLTWAHAYGGPGFAANPVGRGHGDDPRVPTVEHPDHPLADGDREVPPAGFGPINPQWDARALKRGTQYGADYLKTRAPYYAADFDWTFFQAAPADQWLPQRPRGDERLRLVHLHPDASTIEVPLPGVRTRAFVLDDTGDFRELDMVLDTITVDADAMRLFLTWRGVGAVREKDFDDVAWLLIATEDVASTPATVEHYRQVLAAKEEDPFGVYELMPPELAAVAKGEDPPPVVVPEGLVVPEGSQGERLLSKLQESAAIMGQEAFGKVAEGIAKAYEEAPAEQVDEQLAAAVEAQEADRPPTLPVRRPGSLGDPGLRPLMRQLFEQADRLRQEAERPDLPDDARARIRGEAESLAAVPHDTGWSRLDPLYTPPVEPVPQDEIAPGANLSEQDLSGRDLRGADLSGARLVGTILSRANLQGANLAGADLTRALLYKADLTDANLEGAKLFQANAAHATAGAARFVRASLEEASFEDAHLDGARFDEATAGYASFARGSLQKCSLRGADFHHVDLTDADLAGADASGARLDGASAGRLRGVGATLVGASLAETQLEGADLTGADLQRAEGIRCNLQGAILDRADLARAVFRDAHLTKASAQGARMFGTDFAGARLYRTRLDEAVLDHANLMDADLSEAHLDGTRFRNASLYHCRLLGARGRNTDFAGAAIAHCIRDAHDAQ